MNYEIEICSAVDGKFVMECRLDCVSFEDAKWALEAMSQELKDYSDYHINERTNVWMVCDDKEPKRIIHYITARYPNVSLPSIR